MTMQMQQHANKLQRAKEEAALKAMRRLLPDMSPAVWVLALEECNWDVEPAVVMLNTFKSANSAEIMRIQRVSCLNAAEVFIPTQKASALVYIWRLLSCPVFM